MTNFEKITKNENALAKWLSDKIGFCGIISCNECKINCANEEEHNVTNTELWKMWLKQKYTNKE